MYVYNCWAEMMWHNTPSPITLMKSSINKRMNIIWFHMSIGLKYCNVCDMHYTHFGHHKEYVNF